MAVVNFTNLATARASQRAREVALRKVLGANRKQLIVQFVGESILISAARCCSRWRWSSCW
jgi:putative ABC transport system permease protein